jgi:hypothetical protein
MRLLNEDANKPLDRLTIYLTQSEAEELRDSVVLLLKEPCGNHSHVPSSDFQKEITVCIYSPESISTFNERSQRLLLNDE